MGLGPLHHRCWRRRIIFNPGVRKLCRVKIDFMQSEKNLFIKLRKLLAILFKLPLAFGIMGDFQPLGLFQ